MDKSEEQQALKQLTTVITENKKAAESAKTKLKKLKLANDKDNVTKSGSSVVQMKINEWNACARKFQQASNRFQSSLTQFNNELKGRQKRLIGAIDQDLSNEEIEKLVSDPNKAQAYIQESFQMVDVGDAMMDRLAEIESRTQGMRNIYDSLEELRAMWDELNFLTGQQQEMIDNIDYNVQQTSEKVGQATKNLEKAEESQKKGRKCKFMLLCICLALLLVIVLGILGGTGSFSGS
ncbi:syntaxin 3 [Reticulomyxa filosa]|uniref:Syntaxin 3 n=1 Tax=Reticulomyxa filosa TaxID=46433 RepID=X6MYZ0_RETFI|nr:syntaxin 3 [Reticulomyxa filosa]|eukprot:ETO18843.1 syntaxin 3 [Reticulomyxa filosa]